MTRLTLIHLYPTLLNLYGDRGNILTLQRRCSWRGIELRVVDVGLNERFPQVEPDMLFMGGDQDREQGVVVEDLRRNHRDPLQKCIDNGVPFLAVCGSYQLLQNYYRPAEGPELKGLEVFDAHTVHPGHDVARCVGNVVVEWGDGTIVGFENHGGRTYLGEGVTPLGRVVRGFGNNGEDGWEGARMANAFGTYVHGSLLPKNPRFADYLLTLALQRQGIDEPLPPIDDTLEQRAHDAAVKGAMAGPRR
ncbi:MAG: glutamine amidotransferase [Chloroflexota bacterium]